MIRCVSNVPVFTQGSSKQHLEQQEQCSKGSKIKACEEAVGWAERSSAWIAGQGMEKSNTWAYSGGRPERKALTWTDSVVGFPLDLQPTADSQIRK